MRRVGIITKVIIVHAGISLLFLVVSYFFWMGQNKQLTNFSLDDRKRSNIILHNNIHLLSKQLISYTYDYTYWDEMVEFVKKPDNNWAEINIDETLSNFNISFCWVLDSKYHLVYSTNKVSNKSLLNFPLDSATTSRILNKNKFPHFFLSTEKYLLEVTGAPIQHSADSTRTGIPFGYYFTARNWDKNYTDKIETQNQSKIFYVSSEELKTLLIQYDAENNPEIIFTSIPLLDYNGSIYYNLCSLHINYSIKGIKDANAKYIPLLLLAGGIVLVFLLALFNNWILQPIRILSTSLSTYETERLSNLSRKKSVFGDYAKLILEFFNQKKSLEIEIDKRQQAEKELLIKSNAIEQSPLSILITDPSGIVEYVNPKFLELSGYSENDVLNKQTIEFFSEKSSEEFNKEVWQTILMGHDWSGELQGKRKNGEHYWEKVLISPIKDVSGNILHFLSLKEDITEKKKILNELIYAKERVEESSRIKDAFFTNMSHELRTPMIGILGFAELITYEPENPETVEHAKRIYRSGERLLDTLNKILDLSKAKSNFEKAHITTINISDVIKDSFMLFEQAAKNKYLEYSLTGDLGYNYFALSDGYMLNSIFNNLIANAIKFTHRGYVEINISGTDEKVVINIKDSGIGIPQDYLTLIFEEFRRVSEGIGRTFEGTGLGLALAKNYVEILNGTIAVKSLVDKGSVFTVTFPITKKEKNKVLGSTGERIKKTSASDKDSLAKKILIVEDDEITIEVLKSYLGSDYYYDIVNNESDTLELVNQVDYHAIIMDINLGRGGNGIEITKKIRLGSRNNTTHVIAATAFAMAGDKEEFLEAGCDFYLSKPYLKKDLLSILNSI